MKRQSAHSKSNNLKEEEINVPRYSWGIAFISAISLLIVFTVSVDFVEFMRKKMALEQLRKATTSLDYAIIEHATKKSSQTLGLATLTSWMLGRHSEMPVDALLSLVEVIKLVEVDQLQNATQTLDTTTAALSKPYDEDTDTGPDANDPLMQTRRALGASLILVNKSKALTQDIDTLSKNKKDLDDRFQSLSIEILTFLGLPSTRATKQLNFYTSGVLKGLPVFSGIPDKVDTLESFAKILHDEGGSISTPEGANAHQIFVEKLQDFQDRSFSLTMQTQDIQSKIEEKQTALSAAKLDLTGKKQQIKTILVNVIVNINENQIILDYTTARQINNALKLL